MGVAVRRQPGEACATRAWGAARRAAGRCRQERLGRGRERAAGEGRGAPGAAAAGGVSALLRRSGLRGDRSRARSGGRNGVGDAQPGAPQPACGVGEGGEMTAIELDPVLAEGLAKLVPLDESAWGDWSDVERRVNARSGRRRAPRLRLVLAALALVVAFALVAPA